MPVSTIAESVFARSGSGDTAVRGAARGVLVGPDRAVSVDDRQRFVDDVRDALWSSKVVAYAQGLEQIRKASDEYGWDVDIATVARIWRGGCIIRARLLAQISDEYAAGKLATLLVAPSIASGLADRQDAWRRVVALGATAGVPVPGFSSALAYYDTVRAERLPAALVQGLRDNFGAHTYGRTDRDGRLPHAVVGRPDARSPRRDRPHRRRSTTTRTTLGRSGCSLVPAPTPTEMTVMAGSPAWRCTTAVTSATPVGVASSPSPPEVTSQPRHSSRTAGTGTGTRPCAARTEPDPNDNRPAVTVRAPRSTSAGAAADDVRDGVPGPDLVEVDVVDAFAVHP